MIETIQRPRILIVEDEFVVAADLKSSLERLGYEIVGSADTAEAAIEEVEKVRPDLVLMDIQLQGLQDGIAAAEEIRRRRQIAIVFLTANADADMMARARAAGPYGYVIKPFRPNDLNATLLMAMHQHRVVRELFAEQTWLKTTMGSLSDGVIATDDRGFIRYLNAAAEKLIGWSEADAIGKPMEQVFSLTRMDGQPMERCQLRKALDLWAPVGKDRFLVRSRTGNVVPVEDSAAPIVSGEHVLGAVTVLVDITERLRREREQEVERDRLEEQVQAATEALGQTRAELQALSGHLMEAQEAERRRIARELHDDLAQQAALAEMQLEDLTELLPADGAGEAVAAIRTRLANLSQGLREVSHRLHPSVLEDLGLSAALRQLVEQFCDIGIEASFADRSISVELPLDTSTALYRIAQEALRNVVKHGDGAPVRILLEQHGDDVHLTIADAGPGFDLNSVRLKGSLGLVSMQERARLAGGSLLLRSRPGDGTLIQVRVPLNHR